MSANLNAYLQEKTLRDNKKIEGSFKVKEWIAFFENIKISDEQLDRKYINDGYAVWENLIKGGYFMVAFLSIIALISIFFFEDNEIIESMLFIGAMLIGLISIINQLILQQLVKNYILKEDINNVYKTYILPFLYFLKNEIGIEEKVNIVFDNTYFLDANLSKAQARKKEKARFFIGGNENHRFTPTIIKFKLYNDIWITMSLTLVINLKIKNKRKRTDYKTKGKIIHQLRLIIPKDKFIENSPIQPYKIEHNLCYFKLKEIATMEQMNFNSLYKVHLHWAKANIQMNLDQVIRSVHNIYQFVKK